MCTLMPSHSLPDFIVQHALLKSYLIQALSVTLLMGHCLPALTPGTLKR